MSLLILALALILSAALTGWFHQYALRMQTFDYPDARSS